MKSNSIENLKDGNRRKVLNGTHIGKTGSVKDINTSEIGHNTTTIKQQNGFRFKTLAKNVTVLESGNS